MSDELLVERSGATATLTINRPAQRNAISYGLWGEFPKALAELDADSAVRVVLLTGAGDKAFSAGADIKDFEQTRSSPEKSRDYRGRVETACEALAGMSKPTIVVVRGYCIGGGLEFAIHADIRVGDDTAQLSLPAAKRGLGVGHRMMSRLEHLAGAANTSYLLLSARMLNARDAKSAGLLNEVVAPARLASFVEGLATDIAEASPVSHRNHKAVIEDLIEYGSVHLIPSERLDRPAAEGSEDFWEGVQSFKERRKPNFPGR